MQAHTASSLISKSALRILSTHLAAALGVGFMAMSSVYAQQPPPPCHPNPHAAEDKERIHNRGDIRHLPDALQDVLENLAVRPHSILPVQARADSFPRPRSTALR